MWTGDVQRLKERLGGAVPTAEALKEAAQIALAFAQEVEEQCDFAQAREAELLATNFVLNVGFLSRLGPLVEAAMNVELVREWLGASIQAFSLAYTAGFVDGKKAQASTNGAQADAAA